MRMRMRMRWRNKDEHETSKTKVPCGLLEIRSYLIVYGGCAEILKQNLSTSQSRRTPASGFLVATLHSTNPTSYRRTALDR
jgi:hypothetical protein